MAGRIAGKGSSVPGQPTRSKLTAPQLVSLWISNGGSKTASAVAGAVAYAESGGDPNAINHNTDGSIDYGLWQINSVHGVGMAALDPDTNAKLAILISKNGTDWSPWVTYQTGKFKQFLPSTQSAQSGATDPTIGSQISGAVSSIVSPFTDIAKILSFIFSLQFLYILSGGVMLIVALVLIARAQGAKFPM
jgi:hypothetical protein